MDYVCFVELQEMRFRLLGIWPSGTPSMLDRLEQWAGKSVSAGDYWWLVLDAYYEALGRGRVFGAITIKTRLLQELRQ